MAEQIPLAPFGVLTLPTVAEAVPIPPYGVVLGTSGGAVTPGCILVYDEIWVREPRLMVPRGALAGRTRLHESVNSPGSVFFPLYTGSLVSSDGNRTLSFTGSCEFVVKDGRRCLYVPAGAYATISGTMTYKQNDCAILTSAWFGGTYFAYTLGNTSAYITGFSGTTLLRPAGDFGAGSNPNGTGKWSSYCTAYLPAGRYAIVDGVQTAVASANTTAYTNLVNYIGASGPIPTAGADDVWIEWLAVLLTPPKPLPLCLSMSGNFNDYLIPA